MSPLPLVSICIASFNNAPYIKETLTSVRAIDYPKVELIIIDDASQDDSVAVIEQWLALNSDFPARLIKYEQNGGLCRVCNRFVQEAQGEYLSLIGSDDIYLPQKLRVQVDLLEKAGPEYGIVFSDVSKIDSHGIITTPSVYATGQISPIEGDVWLAMLRTNFIGAMTTLTRRVCFEKVGPYDESLAYEDWDMWLRIAQSFKFIYQPAVTALYRIHGNSISFKRRAQMMESNLRIVSKQLGISAEGDSIIHDHIVAFSEELYLLNGPDYLKWLRRRWQLKHDWRGLLLLRSAQIGISATTVAKLYKLIKKINL